MTAFLFLICFCQIKAQTDQKGISAITQVLTYYLDRGTFSDSLMFSKGFEPAGQMIFMRNDALRVLQLMKSILHRLFGIHIHYQQMQSKHSVLFPGLLVPQVLGILYFSFFIAKYAYACRRLLACNAIVTAFLVGLF